MPKVKGFSNKQRAFIREYVEDFNATQAAIRAGYSEKTAGSMGHENLKKPEIEQAIKKLIAEKSMGSDEVLLRLGKIARNKFDGQDTKDMMKALELLGKHHKLFTDKTEHSGTIKTQLLDIDYSALSDEQLGRLANGENPDDVITS